MDPGPLSTDDDEPQPISPAQKIRQNMKDPTNLPPSPAHEYLQYTQSKNSIASPSSAQKIRRHQE